MRKKQETSAEVQVIEPKLSSKAYRKRWAQWIQKIWSTDPFVCPKCGKEMGIVAFIEDQAVIRKILVSMNICEDPERPPPRPLPRALHEYDEYECAS